MPPSMWKTLGEKLGFTKRGSGTGCCGALWGSQRLQIDPAALDDADAEGMIEEIAATASAASAGEMNLAGALAEERRMRAAAKMERDSSLMKRLEEEEEEEERGAVGILGENCCVCMEKKKGAAFIPCGHVFCRACARDLWIERRSCALCNRPILEILDIF